VGSFLRSNGVESLCRRTLKSWCLNMILWFITIFVKVPWCHTFSFAPPSPRSTLAKTALTFVRPESASECLRRQTEKRQESKTSLTACLEYSMSTCPFYTERDYQDIHRRFHFCLVVPFRNLFSRRTRARNRVQADTTRTHTEFLPVLETRQHPDFYEYGSHMGADQGRSPWECSSPKKSTVGVLCLVNCALGAI